MDFDYFYNREVDRFNFLKVSEMLVDGENLETVCRSNYTLFNAFETNRMCFRITGQIRRQIYCYFTVEEIMKRRNISSLPCKALDELGSKKGIGLIESKTWTW